MTLTDHITVGVIGKCINIGMASFLFTFVWFFAGGFWLLITLDMVYATGDADNDAILESEAREAYFRHLLIWVIGLSVGCVTLWAVS